MHECCRDCADTMGTRIALDAIDVVWKAGGRAGVTLSGTVMQTMQNVELTITLRE
ncbi:Baseplate assembly protein W [Escherichia coli]|uniref:Baseplate assembly protein W n=1 Tax=Escherichia coli TaxID=562 RepID=A0A376RAZ1_ECOLX|nr:Baseplate assembly protein W [Escherichia coli]